MNSNNSNLYGFNNNNVYGKSVIPSNINPVNGGLKGTPFDNFNSLSTNTIKYMKSGVSDFNQAYQQNHQIWWLGQIHYFNQIRN